jgi:hypothetical protein
MKEAPAVPQPKTVINAVDIRRNILAEKPRVTCLPIEWTSTPPL